MQHCSSSRYSAPSTPWYSVQAVPSQHLNFLIYHTLAVSSFAFLALSSSPLATLTNPPLARLVKPQEQHSPSLTTASMYNSSKVTTVSRYSQFIIQLATLCSAHYAAKPPGLTKRWAEHSSWPFFIFDGLDVRKRGIALQSFPLSWNPCFQRTTKVFESRGWHKKLVRFKMIPRLVSADSWRPK